MSENLWPKVFAPPGVRTPVSILREQALALGEVTSNIVLGGVDSSATSTGEFRHELYLRSVGLNYLTPLLFITHTIDLYPVAISTSGTTGVDRKAADPSEFMACLKDLFSTPQVTKTIASLIAQSQE
jgi:hypothetical protein